MPSLLPDIYSVPTKASRSSLVLGEPEPLPILPDPASLTPQTSYHPFILPDRYIVDSSTHAYAPTRVRRTQMLLVVRKKPRNSHDVSLKDEGGDAA